MFSLIYHLDTAVFDFDNVVVCVLYSCGMYFKNRCSILSDRGSDLACAFRAFVGRPNFIVVSVDVRFMSFTTVWLTRMQDLLAALRTISMHQAHALAFSLPELSSDERSTATMKEPGCDALVENHGTDRRSARQRPRRVFSPRLPLYIHSPRRLLDPTTSHFTFQQPLTAQI